MQISEKESQISEKDAQISEKDAQINEMGSQLNEKNLALISSAKALKKAGFSTDDIAKMTTLPLEIICNL